MFLLRLIRKFGKLVRGGVAPRQITLGALLGVLIGMIPGFNLSVVLAVFLLLVLNAHVGIALLGFALGKLSMYLLAPITFQVGYFLVHTIGLEDFFRILANTTILALLDLQVYCLTGGIPIAILIGFLFAWLMNRVVRTLRKGIIETTKRSERMRRLASNPLVRFFMWLVFGKKKEDIDKLLQKNPPLFRKSGLALAVSVLIIAAVIDLLLLDYFFAAGLKKGLETVNGAEVNLGEAELSLATGEMTIENLQVTDLANPAYNTFVIEQVAADLNIKELLRRRWVIDLLAARVVQFDVKRDSPGEVFDEPPAKPSAEEKTGIDYLEKARTIRRYLARIQNYLDQMKVLADKKGEQGKRQKTVLIDRAKYQGYLELSATSLLADYPAWLIRKIGVDGVVVPGLDQAQYIEGKNVSSHPVLAPETMAFELAADPTAQPSAALRFNFHDPEMLHEIVLKLTNLPLGEGEVLSEEAPVYIEKGKADLNLEGRFSNSEIDFPFTVALKELEARTREGESVLGLNPETAREVFANIDSFKLVGRLGGSLGSPRLQLDTGKTVASLKDDLVKAGKQKLVQEAEKQVGKATGRLKEEAGKKIKDEVGALIEGKNGTKEDQQESPVDKLKGLF